MTLAYKFLRTGRMGPFTHAAWPAPGGWLDAGGSPELCRCGIHALLTQALPRWMTEELWQVELEGAEPRDDGIVLARRGRLVARVAGWSDETAGAYAADVVAHLPGSKDGLARARTADIVAMSANVRADTTAAAVGHMAAIAAEAVEPGGYDRERMRQAAWLAERLGLS
jgi:hypothetical protein